MKIVRATTRQCFYVIDVISNGNQLSTSFATLRRRKHGDFTRTIAYIYSANIIVDLVGFFFLFFFTRERARTIPRCSSYDFRNNVLKIIIAPCCAARRDRCTGHHVRSISVTNGFNLAFSRFADRKSVVGRATTGRVSFARMPSAACE